MMQPDLVHICLTPSFQGRICKDFLNMLTVFIYIVDTHKLPWMQKYLNISICLEMSETFSIFKLLSLNLQIINLLY